MKEYTIYIRNGFASPYITRIYKSFDEALKHLYTILSVEEDRSRPYYVDNNFFNNKYNQSEKIKYYCIKCRDVSDWEKYSENNFIKSKSKKIVYLQNYKI